MENLPGRLSDPNATFETDPRSDPRIVEAFKLIGGLAPGVETPDAGASYQEAIRFCAEFESAGAAGHEAMWETMPDYPSVTSATETIEGVDGNPIKLFIHRPKDQNGPLPCIYHTHGGGMVIMSAEDPGFVRLRNELASKNLVVVGVEFRNGAGRLGNHPFPAGLNDCASGLKWVKANERDLGIDKIVISGESGGGNLSLATTLKAKQEGWLDHVDGVYAMCPYISGAYAHPPTELMSLKENNGYMVDTAQMAHMVTAYDPDGAHTDNPLAWPLGATPEDLQGLPPHVISVNELDPLRDEGMAYYRKLLAAGVPAVGRISLGTPHAGDQLFADIVPDAFADLAGSITGFAKRL